MVSFASDVYYIFYWSFPYSGHIIVNEMLVFVCKSPCMCAHVLDIADCPPHVVTYEILSYPQFYNLLYYPIYHSAIFNTSDSFCRWL